MPRSLIDAYGTPISVSAISKNDNAFDFDEDFATTEDDLNANNEPAPLFTKVTEPSELGTTSKRRKSFIGVRFGHVSEKKELPPKVVRIWHSDNLFKTVVDKDLGSITSFKSAKVTATTTANQVRDFVAGKLVISDSSQFKLYQVRQQSKRRILDDALIYPLTEDKDIKIAFLVCKEDEDEDGEITTIIGINVYASNSGTYEPNEDNITNHRRLLNHDKFSLFSNMTIVMGTQKIHTFREIVEVRIPSLFKSNIIKKKREKKNQIQLILKEDEKIQPNIMMYLLEYSYCDDIPFADITIPNCLYLLHFAKYLEISRLQWLCEHYLYSILGMHNIYEMIRLASDLKLENVVSFCSNLAFEKWSEFTISKKGLDILGLELFQDITIAMAKKEPVDMSYLEAAAPRSTYIKDFEQIYQSMSYAVGQAELIDGTLPFHRAIVASHDPTFHKFLSQKEQKTFKFPLTTSVFKKFLKYVYFGYSSDISAEDACNILEEMLPKFAMPKFRVICEDSLKRNLTLETVLRSLKLTYLPWNSSRKNLVSLREDSLKFISNNFAEINIPSIREMDPNIAFDLLELMYSTPDNEKLLIKKSTSSKKSPGSPLTSGGVRFG